MLDHHGSRIAKIADHGQGAVEVQQVVVGKLFAVELASGHHAGPFASGSRINGRFLVRILAVAKHLLPLEPKVQRAGESPLGRHAGEIVGNGPIVKRRVGEGLASQLPPQIQRRATAGLDLRKDLAVLPRLGGDRREGMVLAAARTMVGPPMSTCSIASSSVTPGLRIVASKG